MQVISAFDSAYERLLANMPFSMAESELLEPFWSRGEDSWLREDERFRPTPWGRWIPTDWYLANDEIVKALSAGAPELSLASQLDALSKAVGAATAFCTADPRLRLDGDWVRRATWAPGSSWDQVLLASSITDVVFTEPRCAKVSEVAQALGVRLFRTVEPGVLTISRRREWSVHGVFHPFPGSVSPWTTGIVGPGYVWWEADRLPNVDIDEDPLFFVLLHEVAHAYLGLLYPEGVSWTDEGAATLIHRTLVNAVWGPISYEARRAWHSDQRTDFSSAAAIRAAKSRFPKLADDLTAHLAQAGFTRSQRYCRSRA